LAPSEASAEEKGGVSHRFFLGVGGAEKARQRIYVEKVRLLTQELRRDL
jgi:hypothetical protein